MAMATCSRQSSNKSASNSEVIMGCQLAEIIKHEADSTPDGDLRHTMKNVAIQVANQFHRIAKSIMDSHKAKSSTAKPLCFFHGKRTAKNVANQIANQFAQCGVVHDNLISFKQACCSCQGPSLASKFINKQDIVNALVFHDSLQHPSTSHATDNVAASLVMTRRPQWDSLINALRRLAKEASTDDPSPAVPIVYSWKVLSEYLANPSLPMEARSSQLRITFNALLDIRPVAKKDSTVQHGVHHSIVTLPGIEGDPKFVGRFFGAGGCHIKAVLADSQVKVKLEDCEQKAGSSFTLVVTGKSKEGVDQAKLKLLERAQGLVEQRPRYQSTITLVQSDFPVFPTSAFFGLGGSNVKKILEEVEAESSFPVTFTAEPPRHTMNMVGVVSSSDKGALDLAFGRLKVLGMQTITAERKFRSQQRERVRRARDAARAHRTIPNIIKYCVEDAPLLNAKRKAAAKYERRQLAKERSNGQRKRRSPASSSPPKDGRGSSTASNPFLAGVHCPLRRKRCSRPPDSRFIVTHSEILGLRSMVEPVCVF